MDPNIQAAISAGEKQRMARLQAAVLVGTFLGNLGVAAVIGVTILVVRALA
jgi:hypothetical protein